jgi:predicted O-methyltransferase YrrM
MDVEANLDAYRSGSTEPWTVRVVTALARAINPKYVLETGTYLGLTTKELVLALPDATIVTVENDLDRVKQAVANCPPGNVQFIHDDMIHFLTNWSGPKFDFAFVDDDHDPRHVDQELTLLHNPVTGQGLMNRETGYSLITMHDVYGHFGLAGVCRAHHGHTLNFPKLHAAGGLGIIQVTHG